MKLSKKIIKNYLYNVSFQIFSLITPLIVTPYISRILGAENIGIYSYTLSISSYFIILGNLGFPLHGQRTIAYIANEKTQRSIKFFEILYGKIISLFFSIILFIVFIIYGENDIKNILLIQGIGIIADIINIGWFYQAIEEFKITVIRSYFIKIFSIICIFVFVKESIHIYRYTLIINLANLVGNLLIIPNLRNYLDFKYYKISIKNIVKHFKPAILLGIPYYISSLYTLIDKTMLGMLSSNYSEIGFYEQSQKIVNCAMAIVTAVGTVFMPRLANEIAKENYEKLCSYIHQGIEFILLLSLPMMIGLFLLSDMLVPWFYGTGYEKVEGLLKIFSITICILGISNFLGNQYLVVSKNEKKLTITIVMAVIVNIFLNYLLIPQYGVYGAAFGTLIAAFVKVFLQLYMVRKILKFDKVISTFVKYFFMSILMGVVIVFLKHNFLCEKTFINTFFLALVGCITYLLEIIINKRKDIKLNNGK